MPRFKLTLEYDGAPFVGWQRQQNGLSVQEALEGALFAMTGERATAHGAGRTDTGVHALGQVAHVDLAREWDPFRLGEGLNALLQPHPVAIVGAESAGPEFDARRSASARHYRYRIVNRRAPLAIERGRAWRVKPAIDAGAMHEAAQALVGRHDFSTFRDAQCQAKSPVRTLDRLDVRREGDEVQIEASALSFLHRQVRSMVGSLVEVGVGRSSRGDLKAALEAADRGRCGPVAPAFGLYLARVDYASETARERAQGLEQLARPGKNANPHPL
ncbi:MAG TPA: tRNA pseudouridine(38-40) synthase TruA [Roseiarcus sp.]